MPKSWKERRGADRAAENDKEAQREGLNAGVFALRAALILLLCVGVVVLLKYAVEHRRYTTYEVVSSEEREDSVSSYTYVGNPATYVISSCVNCFASLFPHMLMNRNTRSACSSSLT